MGTSAHQDHQNLDLLAQLNKLSEDRINTMGVEELRMLLKQLIEPARLELVRAALEIRARRLELADVSNADLIGMMKTGTYPAA
jgi:hypothetical protein